MTNATLTLFVALIVAMAITGALLIWQIPGLFGPDGGAPVLSGVLAMVFVVLAIGAQRVRSARPD